MIISKALEKFPWLPCSGLVLALAACRSGGADSPAIDSPGGVMWSPPTPATEPISWGPRLDRSELSPVAGAEHDFNSGVQMDALVRAAQAVPKGTTQSSRVDGGHTASELSVRVVQKDAGGQVYRLTERNRTVDVPSRPPGPVPGLALFTDLIPGIEPNLAHYPHELLGIWAWDQQVGTFWSRSPSLEPLFALPSGSTTYQGDAVGLHAADGTIRKFLAKVTLKANVDDVTVRGTVSEFRFFDGNGPDGNGLGDFTVTLGETDGPSQGKPSTGNTTGNSAATGSGRWGARWSDSQAGALGGTFGFAADDQSIAVLGAFTACSSCSPRVPSWSEPQSQGDGL